MLDQVRFDINRREHVHSQGFEMHAARVKTLPVQNAPTVSGQSTAKTSLTVCFSSINRQAIIK
jgi:hypothetical protein